MKYNSKFQEKIFIAAIALPSILAVLLFIGATFLFIKPSFERNMMDRKRETIRELNNSVLSLLNEYHSQQVSGRLTKEQAQKNAASAVRALRYGPEGKDYFWITDLQPKMIAHPYRKDLEGKDLSDFKDSHGKKMFIEFARVSNKYGAGYVQYMWQWKDDEKRIVPKLSYVSLFQPWGWVAGTGIYIEDVKDEIKRLEANIIKISLLIAAIMALMLLYVNRESLKIENMRRMAEKKLSESEEKYRKLTEASTEAIIMVLDGKTAYSNRIAADMLGYSQQELEVLDIKDIFNPDFISGLEYLKELLESEGENPQMETSLKRKDKEFFRALIAASRLEFAGKKGFILSIKDIDTHKKTEEDLAESREKFRYLTDTINLGVMRVDLSLGAVTEANPAAIRLLNYSDFSQMSADGLKAISPLSKAGLFETCSKENSVKEFPVQIKNGFKRSLLVSVIAADKESRIYDCLLEDITSSEKAALEKEKLLLDLQMSIGSLNQSAKDIARPTKHCPINTPISKASQIMSQNSLSAILIDSHEETIAIVTDHDIRERVVAQGVAVNEPVSKIMSSPLISVPSGALLFEAVMLMQERNIRHLVVRDSFGKVSGMIDEKELLALKWYSPAAFMEEFARSSSPEEVIAVKSRLPRLVKTLSDSGADSGGITRLVTSAADSAMAQFVKFAINKLGEPPCAFAFMALGSQSRWEQTLLTDQDNALVYQDPKPQEKEEFEKYFLSMAELVCFWMAESGYQYCKGKAMANNPKWCQPISVWKNYFTEWAGFTASEAMLDVNIFFDFRCAVGEKKLEEELRSHVRSVLKGQKIFFLNLANNALSFKIPVGFRNSLVLDDSKEYKNTFDSKQLIRALTDFSRVYALRHDIIVLPTLDRLAALNAANVLDKSEKETLSEAFKTLMRLRIKRQSALSSAGLPLDNRIKPSELSQSDQEALNEAAAATVFAMNKIRDLVKFLIV